MHIEFDVPLDASVLCEDGECGRSIELIIEPEKQELTHVVVQESRLPYEERLVPVKHIVSTTSNQILLDCSLKVFQTFDLYRQRKLTKDPHIEPVYDTMGYYYVFPLTSEVVMENKSVPKGELPLAHHASIEAVDGHVGRLDELLVDAETDRITHLVMREGHLFGQKDVTIPISEIDHFQNAVIYLKLTKAQVRKLPVVPIRR